MVATGQNRRWQETDKSDVPLEELARCENVCYLSFVTGRYDMIAIVVTRSPDELAQFVKKEISAIPGIVRTESFVNIEIIKGSPALMDTLQLIHTLASQQ
jgi:DNA-binding Lrp family transcriptional regulator